jgi:hypothetical protein
LIYLRSSGRRGYQLVGHLASRLVPAHRALAGDPVVALRRE